jgi:hypothetical protein
MESITVRRIRRGRWVAYRPGLVRTFATFIEAAVFAAGGY